MEKDNKKYNEMVTGINALSSEELDRLIQENKCPFQPELIPASIPIGMYHCEVCGEMVVAGCPHPRKLTDEDFEKMLKS